MMDRNCDDEKLDTRSKDLTKRAQENDEYEKIQEPVHEEEDEEEIRVWNPNPKQRTKTHKIHTEWKSNCDLQLYRNTDFKIRMRSDILFVYPKKVKSNRNLMKNQFSLLDENIATELSLVPRNLSRSSEVFYNLGPSDEFSLPLVSYTDNVFYFDKLGELVSYGKTIRLRSHYVTYGEIKNGDETCYSYCCKSIDRPTIFSNGPIHILQTIALDLISALERKDKIDEEILKKLKQCCFLLVKLLLTYSEKISVGKYPFDLNSVSQETKAIFYYYGDFIQKLLVKDHRLLQDNLDQQNISGADLEFSPKTILQFLVSFRLVYLFQSNLEMFQEALLELKHLRNGIIFPLSARMIYPKDDELWDPSLFLSYYRIYDKDVLPPWLQQKTPHFKTINASVRDGEIFVLPNFKCKQEEELFKLMIKNGHLKKIHMKETMKKSERISPLQDYIYSTENPPVFHLTTFKNGFCKSFLEVLFLSELILSFSILDNTDVEALTKAAKSNLKSLTLIDCELKGGMYDFLKKILSEDSKLAELNIACEDISDSETDSISEILGKSALKNLTLTCDEIHSMDLMKFCQNGKKKWRSVELTNFSLFIPENEKLEGNTFTISSLALFGDSECLEKSAKALSFCSIESLVCDGSFLKEITKFSQWQSYQTIKELKVIDNDLQVILSVISNFEKLDSFRWGITERLNTIDEISNQWLCIFEKKRSQISANTDSTNPGCNLFLLLGFSEDCVEPKDFISLIKEIMKALITRLKDRKDRIIQMLEISISQEWSQENLKEFLKTIEDLDPLLKKKAVGQLKVNLIGYYHWRNSIQLTDIQAIFPLIEFHIEMKQREGSLCDTAEIIIEYNPI